MSEAEASDAGPSSVSYHLIQLLRACVVRFVTRLVGYAILHKDVETRQKQRISDIFLRGGAEKAFLSPTYLNPNDLCCVGHRRECLRGSSAYG